ncbi:TPA: replication endonuclease [Pseudomonas aeruginosa]|uniref:replication endonuclease n=1 Tax=Pseudomonas sp. TaxID=306 RepID=UPI001DB3DD5E|nr:replication endonuclease [Pseudomonas sp.]MBS6037569.1 replication endonuclease [Pseudomonas sp.]
MKTSGIPSSFSPFENYYQTSLPSVTELTIMTSTELRSLGARLAKAYTEAIEAIKPAKPEQIDELTDLINPNGTEKAEELARKKADEAQAQKLQYLINKLVSTPREFGIKLEYGRNTTIQSLAARLSDRKWWVRKITQLADEMREHQAQLSGALGGRRSPMSCCSDATIEVMRERKRRTDQALKSKFKVKKSPDGAKVFSLYEISTAAKKNRLNELFLDIKALETIAEQKSYGCAFITLTAQPRFHSNPKNGKKTYDGSSAREANLSIQKDWRSILDGLDNLGVKRKSGSYFGFRVVELHDDGCPHWHILFFFDKGLGIIESVEKSIERLYDRQGRGQYFRKSKKDIVRMIGNTHGNPAKPSSYIFKYIAFALDSDEEKCSDLAYRYKCAIRAMRARQYDFFGVKCAMGKQRALKGIARTDQAPQHIKKLADELHLPADASNRKERQLRARVKFLEEDAKKLKVSQEIVKNRYGETVKVDRWIKHEDDNDVVQFTGLCEDISVEEARRLKPKSDVGDVPITLKPGGDAPVTISVNYSRKSKDPKLKLQPPVTPKLKYKHDRELARLLGFSTEALYDSGIATSPRRPAQGASRGFKAWCIHAEQSVPERAGSAPLEPAQARSRSRRRKPRNAAIKNGLSKQALEWLETQNSLGGSSRPAPTRL